MTFLFPGGEVEEVVLEGRQLLLGLFQNLQLFHELRFLDDVTDLEAAVPLGQYLVEILDHSVLDLPVGRDQETELVGLGEGAEGDDETDVLTLWSLDGADPAVVGVVNVTDFEARTLPLQTAGAQGRDPSLVGDLRQGVGLVQELGELGGSEELLQGSRDGFGVDQILREYGLKLLSGDELLLDHLLESLKARDELVCDEFAYRSDPPVPQMVTVVFDASLVLQEAEVVLDRLDDVVGGEGGQRQGFVEFELEVELVTTDRGKIVPLGVEEEVMEIEPRLVRVEGLAGAELCEDVVAGVFRGLDGDVLGQSVDDVVLDVVLLGEEDFELVPSGDEKVKLGGVQGFAYGPVDSLDLLDQGGAVELLPVHGQVLQAHLLDFFIGCLGETGTSLEDEISGFRIEDVLVHDPSHLGVDVLLVAGAQVGTELPEEHAAVRLDREGLVELPEYLRVCLELERPEEGRDGDLLLLVDTGEEHPLLVHHEFQLRPAVGHDDGFQLVSGLITALLALLFPVEHHPRRLVKLVDHQPLGAVDDKGSHVRHVGDLSEEDIPLFPDLLLAPVSLVAADDEPQGDVKRDRVGVPLIETLVGRVCELKLDGGSALVAHGPFELTFDAAGRAGCLGVQTLLKLDGKVMTALPASQPGVLHPLGLPALTAPFSNGVVNELQGRSLLEVVDREDLLEGGLNAYTFPFLRQVP